MNYARVWRYKPSLARWTIGALLIALAGLGIWQIADGEGHSESGAENAQEVRIAARRLDDGRTEVAVQRLDIGGWSARIAPSARFLPPDAAAGQWFHSSVVVLDEPEPQIGPLKIAMLQTIHGSPVERRQAFRLAIAHINEAGGVFGRPVVGVIADFNLDEDFIVASARRLVEEDGFHAFVGPTFSSSAVVISEEVSNPLRIPTVSASASSPLLTSADPGDFVFRTTPSDGAGQGAILADLVERQGHGRIGVLYRDDAYGRGLAEEVVASFGGDAISLPVDHVNGVSFLGEIEQVSQGDASVLLVLGCWKESATIISESLDSGLFDQFLLGDCAQSPHLFNALGAEIATGLMGVAPAFGQHNQSTRFFIERFTEAFGQPPTPEVTFVPSVYDATIAVALAAQAAQSTDGGAVRDQLRQISDGQGVRFTADRLAEALEWLAAGRSIDYTGVVSSLDWDQFGDITTFTIGVWRFTADGGFEVTERFEVDIEASSERSE